MVAEAPVGLRRLGCFRAFRYEVRRWPGGEIPALPSVPCPVWGRDELGHGETWNSNSVVSWALARGGLLDRAGV